MIYKQLKKNKQGMSLMEIMVVVGIITLMSSILFVSSQGRTSGRNIKMVAYKISSDIRKMQSYTLNLKDYTAGNYPEGGWGIFLEENNKHYIEFADLDSDSVPTKLGYSGASELYFQNEMHKYLNIEDIVLYDDLGVPDNTSSNVHVFFEPPDPKVYICRGNPNAVNEAAGDCDYRQVDIIIANQDNTNSKTVMVNKFGLIDIYD